MATLKSLAGMSLEALVKLRDDVTEVLKRRAAAIEDQLSRLTARASNGVRDPALKPGKSPPKSRRAKGSARSHGAKRGRPMATAASRAGKSAKKAAERSATSGKAKFKASAKRAKAGKPVAKQIARVEPKAVDVAAAQSSSPHPSSEA